MGGDRQNKRGRVCLSGQIAVSLCSTQLSVLIYQKEGEREERSEIKKETEKERGRQEIETKRGRNNFLIICSVDNPPSLSLSRITKDNHPPLPSYFTQLCLCPRSNQ